MTSWLWTLADLRKRGVRCTLVTVAEARGSTPRDAGAKMVVSEMATYGTIGGGNLEFQATNLARTLLRKGCDMGADTVVKEFPLGPALRQCCGGNAALLFERLDPESPGSEWIEAATELRRRDEPALLVTSLPPSDASHTEAAKLVVTLGNVWGVWSCAKREETAIALAREMLTADTGRSAPRPQGVQTIPVEGAMLLFEPLSASGFNIVLFGAGHVGRALVNVLAEHPSTITWVDSRPHQFPAEVPPNVRIVLRDAPAVSSEGCGPSGCENCNWTQFEQPGVSDELPANCDIDNAGSDAYFLVMTHSHQIDYWLCRSVLRRGDFAYLGLIGSKTKRVKFERRFLRQGIPREAIERLTCPIGVPGITGKHPTEIAVAVAAQLLQLREEQLRQSAADTAIPAHSPAPTIS